MSKNATTICCLCLMLGFISVGMNVIAEPSTDEFMHPAAKLMEIEQKAMQHDNAVRQNMALQEDVAQLRTSLSAAQTQINEVKSRYHPGRLLELERKALSYSYLTETVENQKKTIIEVERQLAEEKYLTTIQAQDLEKLKKQIEQSNSRENSLKEQIVRLRETIDQLRMGNYEFYEVKAGDTLETVAALPMIYNDSIKASLIRQANVRRIDDLDNLQQGDVLIIPRFQSSGKYEF